MRHVLKLDDPGVAPLLLSLRTRFPPAQVSFPVVDHACVPVERVQLAAVPTDVAVVRIVPGGTAAVEGFYSTLLLPVELTNIASVANVKGAPRMAPTPISSDPAVGSRPVTSGPMIAITGISVSGRAVATAASTLPTAPSPRFSR